MATPLKPWERARRSVPTTGTPERSSDELQVPRGAPTIPPRPPPLTVATPSGTGTCGVYTPSYTSYPVSRYPSYGYQPYSGGYSQYGGYGSTSYGSTGYGGQQPPPAFVRQAEERSRTAFQSVESVVGAVASVSMMLESTYFAVHSCFRALLGVAHHFDTLRNHVTSVLTSIALLRKLRLFLLWLLAKLRLRRASAAGETWEELVSAQTQQQAQGQGSAVLWPVLTFFSVVFGVPWLLWKLMSHMAQSDDLPEQQRAWQQQGEGQLTARALYSYRGAGGDELSFSAGDELTVAPQQLQPQLPGWILAGMNRQSGLVPANYVEILPGRASIVEAGRKVEGKEEEEGASHHARDEENSLTD